MLCVLMRAYNNKSKKKKKKKKKKDCLLLHMKRLNQTESPIFLILCVVLFPKAILLCLRTCCFMSNVSFVLICSSSLHGAQGGLCFVIVACSCYLHITKTCQYNFDPLKPHFYIVKLEFTRVYVIFLISAQKHRLWVLVRTASVRRF